MSIQCMPYQATIDLQSYPDGMPRIPNNEVGPITRLLVRPTSLHEFMSAMFLVDAMQARCGKTPELILPFVPGARQDRINPLGDYLFTAKSIAKEINARNFPLVTILDPHSDVTPALIERCEVVTAADCIRVPPRKYDVVISPDGGAEKRASAVAQKLQVSLVHAWKSRRVLDGSINGFGIEHCNFKTALVVDDICDGGGTFVGLGKILKANGVNAHLWTTHGLYTKGTAELLQYYSHLYCTDSVAGPRDGVIEIDICKKLLKGEMLL